MLAKRRFYFLLSFPLLLALGGALALAQINGVPASVTSLGFGGHDNPAPGPRASVTSLGPNGYGFAQPFLSGCCGSFFWSPDRSRFGSHPSHERRRHRAETSYVSIVVPAYIPYGDPYAAEADDEDSDSEDAYAYASETATGKRAPGSKRTPRRARATGADDTSTKAGPAEQTEEGVAVQPPTVLVFKDGHRSEVVNYAIVGDTLFEFAEERTRKILLASLDIPATQKANEERGVEFKLPPNN